MKVRQPRKELFLSKCPRPGLTNDYIINASAYQRDRIVPRPTPFSVTQTVIRPPELCAHLTSLSDLKDSCILLETLFH